VDEGIKQYKNRPQWITGKGLERSSMKSIVIHLSQTGNTEKVARSVRTGIGRVGGQCDLQEIRDADPLRMRSYDVIGLGSPVIGGCSKNVLQFVCQKPRKEDVSGSDPAT
jgi:menaquinone-dependent protoporphyrinogen IX oxidase